MGVYDQVKTAFQDIIAPEILAIHGEIGTLKVEIHRLDEKIDSLRNEVNLKIDGLRAEFTTKIDALRGESTTKIDALRGESTANIDALRRESATLRTELGTKMDALEGKLIPEIRRLDTRLDSLERELKTAIDIRERLVALEAKVHTWLLVSSPFRQDILRAVPDRPPFLSLLCVRGLQSSLSYPRS
jgi:chromosome segregation ATPase